MADMTFVYDDTNPPQNAIDDAKIWRWETVATYQNGKMYIYTTADFKASWEKQAEVEAFNRFLKSL